MNDSTIHDEFLLSSWNQPEKKKKTYGNRTDQRFRKRCRTRGMNSNQIERLLKKRKKNNVQRSKTSTTTMTTMKNQSRKFNKRKRDISIQNFPSQSPTVPKSISSISFHRQRVTKKMKQHTTTTGNSPAIRNDSIFNKLYRFLYLF